MERVPSTSASAQKQLEAPSVDLCESDFSNSSLNLELDVSTDEPPSLTALPAAPPTAVQSNEIVSVFYTSISSIN